MPRYTKKSTNKRNRKNNTYKRYRSIKNIVPDSHVVKLRYVDNASLDANIGLTAQHLYRANSIFDPDLTAVGHQPLGHDQWLPFYDHYTVIGSKCTVHFTTANSDASLGSQMVGVLLQDSTASITNPNNIMEQTGSGYKVLTNASAGQTATVSKGFSAKKFFGLQSVKDNRALIGAAQQTNPTELAYFNVYQTALNSTHNPDFVRIIVTIEYTVLYTERKTLAQS